MEKQTLCSVHGVACWDYTTSLSQYFSLKEVNFVRVCVRSPSLHGDNGGGGGGEQTKKPPGGGGGENDGGEVKSVESGGGVDARSARGCEEGEYAGGKVKRVGESWEFKARGELSCTGGEGVKCTGLILLSQQQYVKVQGFIVADTEWNSFPLVTLVSEKTLRAP